MRRKDDEDSVTEQNRTAATGYTPKHAKPVSRGDARVSRRGKFAVNAPSTGRHAAAQGHAAA
ncbi:MAG: hypothetical protein ACRDN0_15010 [Trebonia sp.]